jgi:hypothetical protein
MDNLSELRKYIRQVLVEGMWTGEWIKKNHPDIVITYFSSPPGQFGGHIDVVAWKRVPKNRPKRIGRLEAEKPSSAGGECDGAWEVYWSDVNDKYSGLGPLLYDIAMELTGEYGLMSDRGSVSSDADRVWKFYDTQRSPEVSSHQLDNLDNDLTPREEDNCSMEVASEKSGYETHEWSTSPHSRRYTKKPGLIKHLEKLGVLKHIQSNEFARTIGD